MTNVDRRGLVAPDTPASEAVYASDGASSTCTGDAHRGDATDHATDAVNVATDVPRGEGPDARGGDHCGDEFWVKASDLLVTRSRRPTSAATSGQGDGVPGATAPRRSRQTALRRGKEPSTDRSRRTGTRGRGPWLDVPATADYLDMTERAVRDLERRGVIPGRRLGRSVRFNLRELDRLFLACREATLEEIQCGPQKAPGSPLGPLMAPQAAADYMGLPSVEALLKRVWRLQVPVYRLSDRILRFCAVELDRAVSGEDSLTRDSGGPTLDPDACLPRGKEVSR